jgi:hypothetical protein
MTTSKRTSASKYRIKYNEWGTAEEYLNKLLEYIEEPLDTMQQLDGDMYLSEYQRLVRGYWLIKNRQGDA